MNGPPQSPGPCSALHPPLPGYAELHCRSAFSFGQGASQPEELVARAHALGYTALAITDECSVAGLVRAHTEAERFGLQLLCGAEFVLDEAAKADAPTTATPSEGRRAASALSAPAPAPAAGALHLVVLARDAVGWAALCRFITDARRAAPKGQYRVRWADVTPARLPQCELILAPARLYRHALNVEALQHRLTMGRQAFGEHFWLAVELLHQLDDALWFTTLDALAAASGVPLVAAGDVRMARRAAKPVLDVLTAIRLHRPLADCGGALEPNAEAHLRVRLRLAALYPAPLLAATLEVAARCRFSLTELRYRYPRETLLSGHTPAQTLRAHTLAGAALRYPAGVPARVMAQIEHELALIEELGYEMYFLTVHDLVGFARSRGILCQGRGSAANSAVCYCLGITEVDPARMNTLFERFISRERNEPPDIDVDFEHQRREEVIQYLYAKYGRDRAALTAVAIGWRPRSALRAVGAALGLPAVLIAAFAREHPPLYARDICAERLTQTLQRLGERLGEAAPAVEPARLERWLALSAELLGLPRHLSQHPGGFVLSDGPLVELVPVENAAMPGRTVIQWDKDDLDALGLLKVDVLALGILSAIRRCLELVSQKRGAPFTLADIPADCPATWAMIGAADTIGVFQIESRAQMSMLPRLQPRCFYDLVIEVAIVRPGPIQGGMVHPYLRRRQGLEPLPDEHPALREALARTLGVPLFQEQVMQIAMLAAGFSAGEADSLRRAMAAWRRKGGVQAFYERIVGGMLARGYSADFAERLFAQIEGFGEYGFPESHAASFALLVWASAWLKCHEHACFLAALLDCQPMGFYSPSQLVQDARRHGVEVRAVDVSASDWHCTLEPPAAEAAAVVEAETTAVHAPQPAVRLGLQQVAGLGEAAARRIVAARRERPFADVHDLARRAALDARTLDQLAAADALASLAGHRRAQTWQAAALHRAPALLVEAPVHEAALHLPAPPEAEDIVFDYAATGFTLRRHPLALLRPRLAVQRLQTAAELHAAPHGRLVRACGLVTVRQSPGTAKGVTFLTLEDETGTVNVIVWPALKEHQRAPLLHAQLLAVYGQWQRDGPTAGAVCHLIAGHLRDLTPLLGQLAAAAPGSRDFR
ncbi:MAG: error-prone DNA polymerase [Rubrivivax sp.]